MVNANLQTTINQLTDKSSSKRRAAAKALRKQHTSEAGPALFIALKKEITDPRTWETQYQMIMAIAECSYADALDFLIATSKSSMGAKIIYTALGDAIVRLTQLKIGSIDLIIENILATNNKMLFDGALRAVALLHLTPNIQTIRSIIDYGDTLSINDESRIWIAAASAGWDGAEVAKFLADSMKSTNQQTKRAAEAALNKKYLKWSPL